LCRFKRPRLSSQKLLQRWWLNQLRKKQNLDQNLDQRRLRLEKRKFKWVSVVSPVPVLQPRKWVAKISLVEWIYPVFSILEADLLKVALKAVHRVVRVELGLLEPVVLPGPHGLEIEI
jgi:hypothetical protein